MGLPGYVARLDPVGAAQPPRRLASRIGAIWRSPQQRLLAVSLLAAFVSAMVFAQITEDYLTNDPLVRWDLSLARWFADHRSDAAVDAFRVVTNLGSPAVSLLIATVVCVVLYRRRRLADAALLPLALGGAELLNLVLKLSFHRARPEIGVVHLDTYSYPSGHAMLATATYGAFAFLFWKRSAPGTSLLLAIGMVAIVGLISFSRLYLGVHYLSDVLAGIAGGAAWLALSVALQAAYGDRLAARFAGSRLDAVAGRLTRG